MRHHEGVDGGSVGEALVKERGNNTIMELKRALEATTLLKHQWR